MKYLAMLTALVALSSAPALAQVSMGGGEQKSPMELLDDQAKAQRAQADKDYQATMKRLRGNDQPAPASDPWGNVRPAQNQTNSGKK